MLLLTSIAAPRRSQKSNLCAAALGSRSYRSINDLTLAWPHIGIHAGASS